MPSVEIAPAVVSFSFIVPVRNEIEDVEAAIRAVEESRRMDAPCELIAVDDASTDGTRDLLRSYAGEGRIRLVEQPEKRGAAAARNAGMEVATGDVVVFMDADNVVPPDFLERLRDHYLEGADFVTVEARVINLERVVGRFKQASHQLAYDGLRNVTYSQSFSCRRALALTVRFHEELNGSADVDFFDRLPVAESRWVRDAGIVVGHRIPDTVAGFWRQYGWRGESAIVRSHVTRSTRLWLLTLRQLGVLACSLAAVGTIVPAIAGAVARMRYSSRGFRDLPAFTALWALQVIACRAGEWRALAFLWTGGLVDG